MAGALVVGIMAERIANHLNTIQIKMQTGKVWMRRIATSIQVSSDMV
jgi:hypothetical protein